MRHIIIDADTGIDDSIAILYALTSENLHVEGITTCFGNSGAKQSADNSIRLIKLSACGYDVPVAVGAECSIDGEYQASPAHIHGANGIGDVELPESQQQPLDMTAEEALEFFENIPKIHRKVQTLVEVGLGYVKLGQSSTTLSGGEAQRVKLATELARVSTGKTIYILDEPTTGLHAADVHKLIEVLQRLVDAGNTVLVIEHNLDVIKTADHIIDLGPEGGDGGGYVVAQGTPEEVAAVAESYTGQYLKNYL